MPPTPPENELLDPKKEKRFFFFQLFAKKGLPTTGEKKSELLDPKIEKSFTACKFKNFDPHPQLDIKF